MRNRLVGAHAAAIAQQPRQYDGRARNPANNPEEQRQGDDRRKYGAAEHQQRGLDAQSLPGDDDVAWPVGKERDPIGDGADQDEIKRGPDHRALDWASAARASAATCRLAARAASRAAAFLLQAAASGFAASGSALRSASAAPVSASGASRRTPLLQPSGECSR